jgi:hypothetical protein
MLLQSRLMDVRVEHRGDGFDMPGPEIQLPDDSARLKGLDDDGHEQFISFIFRRRF